MIVDVTLVTVYPPGFITECTGLTAHLHRMNAELLKHHRTLISRCCATAFGLRPYHAESTGSRPITEVKPRRAWIVLGWATALEPQVL